MLIEKENKILLKNMNMKKITPFALLSFFMLTFFNCRSNDDNVYVDYDTYPIVYDVRNENFSFFNNTWQISKTFSTPMYETDMLLVYMKVGATNNGSPIWQQIPITLYLNDGHEVDYTFDFSRYDFVIYAGGTFDLYQTPYIANKTFRVLLIPASYGGKSNPIDFSNYDEVVNYYNIDDSQPKVL